MLTTPVLVTVTVLPLTEVPRPMPAFTAVIPPQLPPPQPEPQVTVPVTVRLPVMLVVP